MVLVEASRTFCIWHEGDFMSGRQQSMLPSPPTHLRNCCKNLLCLFLHQHLLSSQTRCRAPALRWDCGDTQNTSLSAAELTVSRVEGEGCTRRRDWPSSLRMNRLGPGSGLDTYWQLSKRAEMKLSRQWPAGWDVRRKHLWKKGTLGKDGEN